MWFIFPQIGGLGHSDLAIKFSILNKDEAKAYLDHPILGPRLHECTTMVLKANARSIAKIFSSPDDLKFRSSMTLFSFAAPGTVFSQALEKFFDGHGDPATLAPLTVDSKGDFVRFVEELRADLAKNPDEWENPTLDRFLEAMAAWVTASDNFYRNTGRPVPDNVSWRFFAEALAAARTYE
jgi:uncharacterized protein (DUF1810 family)